MAAPVSPKVIASSSVATVTGFLTWILVTAVPSFHHGLPTSVSSLLPAIVAVILGGAAGWLKNDASRINEVETVLSRVETAASQVEAVVHGLDPANHVHVGWTASQSGSGGRGDIGWSGYRYPTTATSTYIPPTNLEVVSPHNPDQDQD